MNEGRGEYHSFGESFPSNKAIMLSPPTLLLKGAVLGVEPSMPPCKVVACLLPGNLVQGTRFHLSLSFSIIVQRTSVNLRNSGELCLCDCWKGFWNLYFSTEKAPFWEGTREAGMEREDERLRRNGWSGREGFWASLRTWSKHRLPSSAKCEPSSAIAPSSVSFTLFFYLQCFYLRRTHNAQCAN